MKWHGPFERSGINHIFTIPPIFSGSPWNGAFSVGSPIPATPHYQLWLPALAATTNLRGSDLLCVAQESNKPKIRKNAPTLLHRPARGTRAQISGQAMGCGSIIRSSTSSTGRQTNDTQKKKLWPLIPGSTTTHCWEPSPPSLPPTPVMGGA